MKPISRAARFAALVGASVLALAPLTSAAAAGSSPSPAPSAGKTITVPKDNITFAVGTSTGTTPDGRHAFEIPAAPGSTQVDHIVVYNLGRVTATFALYAVDAVTADDGSFTLSTLDRPQHGFGLWTTLDKKLITLRGGESQTVGFTVSVPANARPGDTVGGVMVSSIPRSAVVNQVAGALSIATRVGVRSIVRVQGDLHAAVEVSNLASTFEQSASTPGFGRLTLSWDVKNTGNVRVGVKQGLDVSLMIGGTALHADENPLDQVLPGDTVHQTFTLDHVFAGVRIVSTVHDEPVLLDGQVASTNSSEMSTTSVAISWLLIAIISFLFALAIFFFARLRGRRSASGGRSGGGGSGGSGRHGGGSPQNPNRETVGASS